MQSGTNSLFEEENLTDSMYTFNESPGRRVLTAPAGPLSELGKFKRDKEFILLQQFVIACNQLIHKSHEKYDIESEEGQVAFRKYLEHLEALFPAFKAVSCDRSYRDSFSKAYSTLYNEGQLCYLTEIWDSAQQAFLFLWVNGQKYPFSQEVLSFGSRLVSENFKLQHIIKGVYLKILDEVPEPLQAIVKQITLVLEQFDSCWTTYEQKYIRELMNVEHQAKSIIVKAIELERSLYTEEIGNKLKYRFSSKSPLYYETRNKLIMQLSKINSVANDEGKGRDDLHPCILLEAEGLLRKITPQQSKAVRVLAQRIKSSFLKIRQILRKYDSCIDQIDPQLKNNQDLVQALIDYQASWQKGKAYIIDGQKLKTFIDFTNVIETASQKYECFKEQLECRDSIIFMIIPSLIVLKTLDDEFPHFSDYFPLQSTIHTRQVYQSLKQQFQEWKTLYRQSYLYFNAIEKQLMGLQLSQHEQAASRGYENYQSIVSKIKQLSVSVQRSSPVDWNSLLEAALIDC